MNQTVYHVDRDAITINRPKVVHLAGKQICIWQTAQHTYAFNHRCPHEGYPLSKGELKDCVLTCHWHNWKFDLRDGHNLDRLDDLRTYPCQWDGDRLAIDLSEPDPETVRMGLEVELEKAMRDRSYDRIARVLAKFRAQGISLMDALSVAVIWSHDRFEYGTTHALGAAADWIEIGCSGQLDQDAGLACVLEVVDHLAFDALRQPRFPFSQDKLRFEANAMIDAIDAEDEDTAIAMANDAMHAGRVSELREALISSSLVHYRGFGHSLIFTIKSHELIETLGDPIRPYVVRPLIRELCNSTREDKLPEFGAYATTLGTLQSGFGGNQQRPPVPAGASVAGVFRWLRQHQDRTPEVIFDALVQAVARNLLHFDEEHPYAVAQQVALNANWLDLTHGITFADAALLACRAQPARWPAALLQLACFVGRNSRFIKQDQLKDETIDLTELIDPSALIDHGIGLPIHACHRIKTYRAAFRLEAQVSRQTARFLIAALQRYLNARYPHKSVLRTAHQMARIVNRDFPNSDAAQ